MSKKEALIAQYCNALERLKESVAMELQAVNDEFREALRDSVIQRFEFTVDLAWKVLKVLLVEKDIECSTPKDCLRTAFEKNILARDDFWFEMITMRNLSSHVYNQKIAIEIVQAIPQVILRFEMLASTLKSLK